MSTATVQEITTFLADVIRTLAQAHAGASTHEPDTQPPVAYSDLLARAEHVLAALKCEHDQVLFQQIEQAGAADIVSNTVDQIENMLLTICPVLQVDPKVMLRAVILTARQRLDWGYGPIGGVHDGATAAQAEPGADVPGRPQRPHQATSRGRRRSTRQSSSVEQSDPAA